MAEDSGLYALAQIGVVESESIVNVVYDRAVKYARNRAAEMVGKKWVNGELVDNPNARFAITDSTRDEVQRIIASGLDDNLGKEEITDLLENSLAFSSERAEKIANTEIGTANSQGALEGYKAASDLGINVLKDWVADENPCEDCQANEDAGPIGLDESFPSGVDAPLAHPGCECVLSATVVEDDNATNTENNQEE